MRCLTWVHTNNVTIPPLSENTHLGSRTITLSVYPREYHLQAQINPSHNDLQIRDQEIQETHALDNSDVNNSEFLSPRPRLQITHSVALAVLQYVVMFQAQNRETINSTYKVDVSFEIITTTSVTRPHFTTQHQTCKTKTKTEMFV